MSGGEIDVRLHWQEYAYFSVYESRLCRGEHEFPRREREKENEREPGREERGRRKGLIFQVLRTQALELES